MASPRRFAEARVLKPVMVVRQVSLLACTRSLHGYYHEELLTFVCIDYIVFYHNVSPIDCVVLLGLASHLSQIGRRLLGPALAVVCARGRSRRAARVWDTQDMAGEEVIGGDRLGDGGAGGGLGLARGEENIGCGHEEDVELDRAALRRDGALEEGGEEWV